MIQAAEPHPDDEHYRQTEPRGEVGAGLGCVERHEKTADAFHHLAVLLVDAADYVADTGEPVTAEVLRIAAGVAHQLAERERAEAA